MPEQLSDYRESHWKLPPESLRRREKIQRRVRNKLGLHKWKQVVRTVANFNAAICRGAGNASHCFQSNLDYI